jgi:peroxiredoxin
MSTGLIVGAPCPEVQLVSGAGPTVNLAERAAAHRLVVVFYHLAFTGG